jgi:6-phosphogluconolactonase
MRSLLIAFLLTMTTASGIARELLVYIGTYTKTSSKGIYVARFDPLTGKLGEAILAAETVNPSFLTLSPDRRHLYAVGEGGGATYNGQPSGTISAYSINPADGKLALINTTVTAGRSPCHVSITPDKANVLVANYSSGTVTLLPVLADGGLDGPAYVDQHEGKSVHPSRQKGPYAHSITPSADGRFAFAADLGTDKIYTYRIDSTTRTLAPAEPASVSLEPGSGPRHLALSPDGRRAYVINELSSTLTTFNVDTATGALKAVQTLSTLPTGFTGNSTTAEVTVHPSGRFVYGSNRGHDSIAVFKADPENGTLTAVDHTPTQGRTPRNFSLDPSGHWLIAANQDGDSLVVFAVDQTTGRLTPTGQTLAVGMPVCVRFY